MEKELENTILALTEKAAIGDQHGFLISFAETCGPLSKKYQYTAIENNPINSCGVQTG